MLTNKTRDFTNNNEGLTVLTHENENASSGFGEMI